MADKATLWAQLTTLIEKIIARALDEQQENLFNILVVILKFQNNKLTI